MNLVGMQESFNDYPGEICIILFTKYCNLDCVGCYNKRRVLESENLPLPYVHNYLRESAPLITHVTISGGEPTMETGLLDFLGELHSEGFGIKLDTNGTNPTMLRKALPFLSVVAMDIKEDITSYARYKRVCRELTQEEFIDINISAHILSTWNKEGKGKTIFRTTLFDEEVDTERIKHSIRNLSCSDYMVQDKVKFG